VIEVVMRIVGARIVSGPSIVPGVNVRNGRMTFSAGLAQVWKPSREQDREAECAHRQPPRSGCAKAVAQIRIDSNLHCNFRGDISPVIL